MTPPYINASATTKTKRESIILASELIDRLLVGDCLSSVIFMSALWVNTKLFVVGANSPTESLIRS